MNSNAVTGINLKIKLSESSCRRQKVATDVATHPNTATHAAMRQPLKSESTANSSAEIQTIATKPARLKTVARAMANALLRPKDLVDSDAQYVANAVPMTITTKLHVLNTSLQ